MSTLIADQVILNTAALSCYTQIAAAMPDAATVDEQYGWYFSEGGKADMTEEVTINDKLWHYKTFSADAFTSTDPTGTYAIRVYNPDDLPSP